MIKVVFYGENNELGLPANMIMSKYSGKPIVQDGQITGYEPPESYPENAVSMTIEELQAYEEAHEEEWNTFLATYVQPEVINE